jgi:hypothetical protein
MPVGTPQIRVDGVPRLNNIATNKPSVMVEMTSSLAGATIFYTLDGSTNFDNAQPYVGTFEVDRASVIHAVARLGGQTTAVSPGISISVPPWLSATEGGTVTNVPSGTRFPPGTVVHLAAKPNPGWQLIGWEGDVQATSMEIDVLMDTHKTVKAVFGTTLALTSSGSGHIEALPARPLYPFGSSVRLFAVPDPGNYFALWGKSATGTTNHLDLTITEPREVSALFLPIPASQVSLTILPNGRGRVSSSPGSKLFLPDSVATLTALADEGSAFLGWTGDLATNSPSITLTLTNSLVLYANFTGGNPAHFGAAATFTPPKLESTTEISTELTGAIGTVFSVQRSEDLVRWNNWNVVTNLSGTVRLNFAPSSSRLFFRVSPE